MVWYDFLSGGSSMAGARAMVSSLLMLLTCGASSSFSATCENAELIVHNAKIVTMDPSDRIVEAMAVRDGRIVAVGTNKEVDACAGKETRRLELQGKTILPGLIDVHTHALEWAKGVVRDQVDATYPGVKSIAALMQEIERRAQSARPGGWIVGAGWDDAKYEGSDGLDAGISRINLIAYH